MRNAGAKVEDAGVPLAQRVTQPRDDGLQRALAASRADFDAEEQKRLAEREDEELAKALMLSAAAASEDDRRRREQEAAEASRSMAEMAAAKQEAKEAEDAEADRRVAEVVVAGTDQPENNVAEAERRAAAARAQLAQIEQAPARRGRRSYALRKTSSRTRGAAPRATSSGNWPSSRSRRLDHWPLWSRSGARRRRARRAPSARLFNWEQDRPSTASSATLWPSWRRSTWRTMHRSLRQEQIDCIADLKILNNEDLEACGIPPRDAATMMAGLADLHPGVADRVPDRASKFLNSKRRNVCLASGLATVNARPPETKKSLFNCLRARLATPRSKSGHNAKYGDARVAPSFGGLRADANSKLVTRVKAVTWLK